MSRNHGTAIIIGAATISAGVAYFGTATTGSGWWTLVGAPLMLFFVLWACSR